ncbi:MAG: sigma-E processing peptidase SpoIIGA [Ruminococcus sp.]|nr:sigma-E processing peptidase SpoIIGA [Ruminococcus sp.]
MTIYVDTLIFTNIIIDYLLLILTAKILKINFRYSRAIIGAVAGGFSSLIILLPEMIFIFNLLVRISITLIIILTAFGFGSKRIFFKRTFMLFIISTSFSGIILFLLNIFKSDFIAINNSTVYINISPLMLIIFTTIAYAVLSVIDRLRIEKTELIHKICFLYKGSKYSFLSRYDTCCNVKEPFSGNEVIITESHLIDGINVSDGNYRLIPFNSLGGEGLIKGFLPDELYIDNEKIQRKVYIGVCENVLNGEVCSIFNYKNICE